MLSIHRMNSIRPGKTLLRFKIKIAGVRVLDEKIKTKKIRKKFDKRLRPETEGQEKMSKNKVCYKV